MNWQELQSFSSHPLVISFGWALFHFLWQALLIAGVIGAIVTGMPRVSAWARYLVAYAGLSLMALAPIVTTVWCYSQQPSRPLNSSLLSTIADASPPSQHWVEADPLGDSAFSATDSSKQVGGLSRLLRLDATGAVLDLPRTARHWYLEFEAWLPLAVSAWGTCVFVLSARLAGGLWRVNRLRQAGTSPASEKILSAFEKAKAALAIPFAVTILESTRASVPMVLGFFRPVILVPTSVAIGLTPSELESLLAHELAHVKRHDYLLNIIQTVIETLLFYHPAVWWLSRLVRSLREDCCDDEAIRVCGNRMVLARALAQIEEIRCRDEGFALAASGGSLLRRIRRVVGREESPRKPWWLAGFISLSLLFSLTLAGGLTLASSHLRPVSGVQKNNGDQNDGGSGRDGSNEGDSGLTSSREDSDDKFPTYQREVEKIDSRSGDRKSLLAEITLTNNSREGSPDVPRLSSKLDMVYSTVFSYSVIPSRVARELNAEVLGEIDFGKEPPKSPTPQILLTLPLTPPNADPQHSDSLPGVEPAQSVKPSNPTVYHVGDDVGEMRNVNFVPFENEPIWVPGHLGFYNMNATNQTKFKVVRIGQVNLGLGPKFGPAYALVSDDANSDFGVLGRDWASKPRGPNGEGFAWAATGEFYFMKFQVADPAEESSDTPSTENAAETSNAHQDNSPLPPVPMPPEPQRQETGGQLAMNVIASHSYDLNQRSSSDWIEMDGVQVPVDAGVESNGIRVYVTLMFDVVAVNSATKKVLWHVDWEKSAPIFSSICIAEVKLGDSMRTIVQLIPNGKENDPAAHQFRDLQTGKEVALDQVLPQAEKVDASSIEAIEPPNRRDIPWRRISEGAEGLTQAELASESNGRGPLELTKRFAFALERGSAGWVTDFETLVSAENATYIGNSIEAQEIIFNLPEGSGIRAELNGEQIEFRDTEAGQEIVVTGGRIDLYDAGGVLRAWASPDGGAEQLVVKASHYANEFALRMKTRRVQASPDYPQPPVQAVMFCETGAQQDETQPPHGAIRYELQPPKAQSNEPFRMKMKFHYDLKRFSPPTNQVEPIPQLQDKQSPIEQSVPTPESKRTKVPTTVAGVTEFASQLLKGDDWLGDANIRFSGQTYSRIAELILQLAPEDRFSVLRNLAREGMSGQLFALCRMVFAAKPDGTFRRPLLGQPHFVGENTTERDFPLEPIMLVDNQPFLIVKGYSLAGQPETAANYLEYCIGNCVWTDMHFESGSALTTGITTGTAKLQSLDFWGITKDQADWSDISWLSRQYFPGCYALIAKQQSWVNQPLPMYILDDGTRVSPDNVVQQIKQKAAGIPSSALILKYENCRPEWFQAIVLPLVNAGVPTSVLQIEKSENIVELKNVQELNQFCSALLERTDAEAVRDNSLALNLTLLNQSLEMGVPVNCQLVLKNTGVQPESYDPQDFEPYRVIRVTRADDGLTDWFIGTTPQTSGQLQELASGGSVELWNGVDLSSLYLLDEGKYKVQVVWIDRENKRELKSNQVELEISGGTLPPTKQLLKELRKVAPEGWEVSRGIGEIYISHSPTNLKRDVTTITLSLVEEKAAEGTVRSAYLGKHAAGHIYLSAPPKAAKLWASHLDAIKSATFPQSEEEADRKLPWQVTGTVTDPDGKPMSGVVIRAHTGVGTLHLTGETVSDSNGKYVMKFGPGVWSPNETFVQAATISVHKDGYFEKNLHRQGDKLAAMRKPTGELGWGERTIDDVFLPDQPKIIDFQMLPATKMSGFVIDSEGKKLEGVRVSLVGPDMPPSSSVVAATRTDKGGQFELPDLPTGYKYQILIEPAKAESPWLGWASPPIELCRGESANNCFQYLRDNQTIEVTADQLWLEIKGVDTNWKDALANAAKRPFTPKFNGLSNSDETQISAGMLYIEMGN